MYHGSEVSKWLNSALESVDNGDPTTTMVVVLMVQQEEERKLSSCWWWWMELDGWKERWKEEKEDLVE